MIGAIYQANRDRILDVIKDSDPDSVVPACPAWTTADVVRHLTGLAADVTAGNVDGYGGEPWTANQVESRAATPLPEVIAEWASLTSPLVALLDNLDVSDLPEVITTATGAYPRNAFSAAILGDLLHHEFDLRNACLNRDDRERPDVVMAAIGHAKVLRPAFAAKRLPTLRVSIDDGGAEIDVGRTEPTAIVHASSFETLRSIGGRRTVAEIRELHWEGDAATFIPHFVLPFMQPASASIGER